jgi:DNA-binding GntR family transcriptional regulator
LNASPPNLPVHEIVHRRLREMILCGELEPGQPVTIQGLVAKMDVGMTPVREAIRRLIAEGALDFQGNRRICVPVLTLAQLDELAFARLSIEPQLAFWATNRIDDADIGRLTAIDADLNRAIARGDVRAYMQHNHAFHQVLNAAADAEILAALAETLWLRMGPALRVMCGRFGTANLPDMHADALTCLHRRDAAGVRDAIHADIAQGIDQVRRSLSVG